MRWLLPFAVFAVPVQAADWKAVVEKPAEEITKDRKYAVVVVGVLDGDKEEVFAFGEWDGKAPDRDSVFEIGSITKVFTGILLADRVKAGVVTLDDPVQKHLPDGWTVPRRDDRDITLLHLATHTSGLPKGPKGFLATAILHPNEPFKYLTEDELKKALPETPIQTTIGARSEYSNLGVGLLGHALVHASKAASYEALVTERVLKPLGMSDTAIALSESQTKRLIPGHLPSGKRMPNWDFPTLPGCGAIRSTVGDVLKFVKANANPTGVLADAMAMTHQNWRDVRPKFEETGLCWIRYQTGKKDPPVTLWHNGQTGGYHSFVGFVPGRGGVVVLCNVATFDVDKVGAAVINQLAEAK
jgi:D-alanyl-D-alanine-carboxypeptidase/D-alanyl-D-alanine-endopeptidase